MAFKSKDGKSYGSIYVAKRKDEEHAKGNPEPNEEAEPKHHGGDEEVNHFSKSENVEDKHEVHEHEPAEHDEPEERHDESPVHIHFEHDHDGGEHKVHAEYADGSEAHTEHPTSALAYEAGGTLQAASIKDRTKPDQMAAASEGDNPKIPAHEKADLV